MGRFCINDEDIVFEVYEEETILLNLRTGAYYTLDPVGASFLKALVSSPSLEGAEEILVDHYGTAPDKLRGYLRGFVAELEAEKLVQHLESSSGSDRTVLDRGDWPTSLAPPKLEKYTDVEDLLLIDPVHEVKEEEGWPEPQDR